MIMSHGFRNRLKQAREVRGWSQGELAERTGLSRTGVGAIENGRLVPSTAASLALGKALGCAVEELFWVGEPGGDKGNLDPIWAWPALREPWRYWRASVGGREILYPVEATVLGSVPHDGVAGASVVGARDIYADAKGVNPARTLVVACCDPAAGLLAAALREAGVRLIVLTRSSREALLLLKRGLVHAAGVHLASAQDADGNGQIVRSQMALGFRLLRVARWEEGVALSPSTKFRSVGGVLRANLRWVGREAGSGARRCLDELLEGRKMPTRLAHDHHGVAEAVRCGWAQAGICLRLSGEEAGLDFLAVRQEPYDLCFSTSMEDDPRLQALVNVVRGNTYGRLLADLPGYETSTTGQLQSVN